MTSEATTKRHHGWNKTLRLGLASLICLLILAITIPNLGRIDAATHTIKHGWYDGVSIGIITAPLALIFIGAAWSRVTERVGWVLLLILLVLRFVQ